MSEELPYGKALYYLCAIGLMWVRRIGNADVWYPGNKVLTQHDIADIQYVLLTADQMQGIRFERQEEAEAIAKKIGGTVWVKYQANNTIALGATAYQCPTLSKRAPRQPEEARIQE